MRGCLRGIRALATLLLLTGALLACGGSSETPVESANSHEGHDEEKDSDHHDHHDHHAHDHGSSNMMMSISPEQADVLVEIEFRGGEVFTPSNRVTVAKGDQIVFAVISDVDEFIHVHGVDYMGEVSSGGSTNYLGFTMDALGIFEVEFENSEIFIIELLASS